MPSPAPPATPAWPAPPAAPWSGAPPLAPSAAASSAPGPPPQLAAGNPADHSRAAARCHTVHPRPQLAALPPPRQRHRAPPPACSCPGRWCRTWRSAPGRAPRSGRARASWTPAAWRARWPPPPARCSQVAREAPGWPPGRQGAQGGRQGSGVERQWQAGRGWSAACGCAQQCRRDHGSPRLRLPHPPAHLRRLRSGSMSACSLCTVSCRAAAGTGQPGVAQRTHARAPCALHWAGSQRPHPCHDVCTHAAAQIHKQTPAPQPASRRAAHLCLACRALLRVPLPLQAPVGQLARAQLGAQLRQLASGRAAKLRTGRRLAQLQQLRTATARPKGGGGA